MTTDDKEIMKEFMENLDMLIAIEKFMNNFSEYAFTSVIGTLVDGWCKANDHPHEKGMEILDNILAVRDGVEEILKEEESCSERRSS